MILLAVDRANLRIVPGAPSSCIEFTPTYSTILLEKEKFKYNLGKFLNFITFLSCSSIMRFLTRKFRKFPD